ncbi:MAG: CYTH domain-containing protein [Bacteroidota bacterium]
METRKLILALLIIAIFPTLYGQTESQRKYLVADYEGIKAFIQSSQSTASLSTHFHSDDTYYDLYLDSPDFLLLKNRMSLRFRKRVPGNKKKKPTYAFQLKSEMDSLNSVRMEVEETELDFYMLKSGDQWIAMSVLLDSVFKYIEESPDEPINPKTSAAFALIQDWVEFKAGGAIAPFQKLLFLGFSLEEVQSLRPTASGKTQRMRSHIYSNAEQTALLDLAQNRIKENKLPKFFKKKGEYNWLLESSLDRAVFIPLYTSKVPVARISEYEVENKYYQAETGEKISSIYAGELSGIYQLSTKLDSKYRQAIQAFGEHPK